MPMLTVAKLMDVANLLKCSHKSINAYVYFAIPRLALRGLYRFFALYWFDDVCILLTKVRVARQEGSVS